MSIAFDKEMDARGMNCPMPLVNARKEINALAQGQVLRVVATDKGSVADFQGWAKIAKNIELVGQETDTSDGKNTYIHYVKRTS